MRPVLRASLLLLVGVLLTFASSAVKRTRLEVQDWDCPPTGSCARPVVVSGFPFIYISDFHGISAVGDAALVSALLGDDIFHRMPFAANVTVYALLAGGLWMGLRRRAGRRGLPQGPRHGSRSPGGP